LLAQYGDGEQGRIDGSRFPMAKVGPATANGISAHWKATSRFVKGFDPWHSNTGSGRFRRQSRPPKCAAPPGCGNNDFQAASRRGGSVIK